MQLRVNVVGAGIGGLATAVALKQAGHKVTVFEKSRFATEIGAALAIWPNGARVLDAIGFSFENAQAVDLTWWKSVDGLNLEDISTVDLSKSKEQYGYLSMSIHRVDLHNELLRLAKDDGQSKDGSSVELKLASTVIHADPDTGTVELEDGSKYESDLTIGADGLRSVVRKCLTSDCGVIDAGLSAFRFLIPDEKIQADQDLESLLKWKKKGSTILIDTKNPTTQRHAVWYTCRSEKVHNLVGIYPLRPDVNENKDFKKLLLEEFSHFNPDVVRLFNHAEHVNSWPLYYYNPLPKWSRGKAVLVGDAAHPMLPFAGQAANQALEDAGALGYFMKNIRHPSDVPDRLALFEKVRRKRASMIQVLSSAVAGHEMDVHDKILPYAEDGFLVPKTFQERTEHAYSFDVYARCREILPESQML